MPDALSCVRIDRWLWAVRLYKTRALAAKACAAGHVKIGGLGVKPSRDVRIGDIISARTGFVRRTIKVLAMLEQRIGAKAVAGFMEDQTTPEEFARAREDALKNAPLYPPGLGRPTKKQRRQLDRLSAGD